MLDNPLKSWSLPTTDEPLLGLLHCDVDAAASSYAPVTSGNFYALPHQGWFLGHIHVPKVICHRPLVRYCGSLQGLDVSEHGSRGAWLVTINADKQIETQALPLAPLRWEQLSLDLSAVTLPEWEGQVLDAIEKSVQMRLDKSTENINMLGVRLTFTGRTEIYRELRHQADKFQQQENSGLYVNGRWISYFVESIRNLTAPLRNLERLAAGSDFVAALARKLIALQQANPFPPDIFQQLEKNLAQDPYLKQCPQAWPIEEECQQIYLQQGFELLDELLEQKGS